MRGRASNVCVVIFIATVVFLSISESTDILDPVAAVLMVRAHKYPLKSIVARAE